MSDIGKVLNALDRWFEAEHSFHVGQDSYDTGTPTLRNLISVIGDAEDEVGDALKAYIDARIEEANRK